MYGLDIHLFMGGDIEYIYFNDLISYMCMHALYIFILM